jgi:cytochrome c553
MKFGRQADQFHPDLQHPVQEFIATSLQGEKAIMKKLTIAVFLVCLVLLPLSGFAAGPNGADLFKAKCAVCHGPDGAGKAAMKTPPLSSPEVQGKSDKELADFIATNPKHNFAKKGMTPDEINALVAFIRTLKK